MKNHRHSAFFTYTYARVGLFCNWANFMKRAHAHFHLRFTFIFTAYIPKVYVAAYTYIYKPLDKPAFYYDFNITAQKTIYFCKHTYTPNKIQAILYRRTM